MTQRALHMLRLPGYAARPATVRETVCGRVSAGGGLGTQILTFSEDTAPHRHVSFEATEITPAVTCRKCLKAMARERA